MTVTTAEKVKHLRLERRWSQEELAAAAHLNKETVNRIELGAGVRMSSLHKLATALDQPVGALLGDGEGAADLQDHFSVSADERELLDLWRRVPDDVKAGMLTVLRQMPARTPERVDEAAPRRKKKTA